MKRVMTIAALSFVLPLTACSWKRTPIPIYSETGATALLVGAWSGEYSSSETGRRGSISFDLESEKDTAFCDVTMAPLTGNAQMGPVVHHDGPTAAPVSIAQPLQIKFIRLGGNRISGTLEPYTDPDCGCRVTTMFVGMVTGPNKIEGTYTTVGSGLYEPTKGRWSVERRAIATNKE